MIAALLLLSQALPPRDDAPRLHTVLTNGSVILAERVAGAKTISVQLWVSSRGTRETPSTQGMRHLLEHLVARGADRTLDQRLETAGGFLQARTYRDSMVFDVTVSPSQLGVGLSAVQEMLRLGPVGPAEIAHETKVISEEGALRGASATLANAAWTAAYGDSGLDPFGNLEILGAATPETLAKLHRTMFSAQNLALVVAGNIDLDDATRKAKDVLAPLAKAALATDLDTVFRPGTATAECSGHARAAGVGSFRDVSTLATLAAGLAMASEVPHSFLTYTPSVSSSLVVVGMTRPGKDLESALASDPARLYNRGRQLVRRWLEDRMDSPAEIASSRGQLLCQGATLRPERMLENLDLLTFEVFQQGLDRFQDGAAVVVEGNR